MEKLKKTKSRPKGCKRTPEQQDADLLFCSDLFLRGYSYREIADALNRHLKEKEMGYTITFQMVYYDLQRALVEWKRERFENIDEYITQELKKLDKMEVEAWNAWEESKTGKRREKNRTSAGNPRFLDLLLNVQQRRAKLLGYDAPVKMDLGMGRTDFEEKESYDVSAIPKDLLFAVVDQLQNAKYSSIMTEKGVI